MTMNNAPYPSVDNRGVTPQAGSLGSVIAGVNPGVVQNSPHMVGQPQQQTGISLGSILGGGQAPAPYQALMSSGLDGFQPQAQIANETTTKKFYLEWIQLQEAPEYLDHYNRHYIPSSQTDGALSDLAIDVARAKGVPSAPVLAVHASQLFDINMSPNQADIQYIPGGFRHKRLKFLMLVREEDIQFGKTHVTYVNGFTDHYGLSLVGGGTSINEDMVFYINSLVTLAEEFHVSPETGVQQRMWNVVQATQVVDGQLVGMDPTGTQMHNVNLLRPADLITSFAGRSDVDTGVSGWFTVDGTRTNAGGAMSHFNNMANNLPSSYLDRLLKPILGGLQGVGGRPGIGGLASSMNQLAGQTEFSLVNCAFLRYMAHSTGMPLSARFTMNQLNRLDNTISQRTKHFPIKQADFNNLNAMSIDSTPWNYVSPATKIATKLVSTIPSLMWENFAISAAFSVTNATPGRMVVFKWEWLQFITPTGLPGFQQRFENNVINTVMPDITRGGQEVVSLRIFVDTSGEIITDVSYEGQKSLKFTSPAFAAGILNPIHTNNDKVADNVVNGFGAMVDAIKAVRDTEVPGLNSQRNYAF